MEGDSVERTELINRILFYLGILEGEINAQLRNGRTDIMHKAEMICQELLNHIYDYQLQMIQNARSNYAAVDLADSAHSVAVQVTTVRTNRKIQQTIDLFRKHGLHHEFKTLIILIPSTAPKPTFRLNFKNTAFDLVIMNLTDIAAAVKNLTDTEKLRKIVNDLTQELGYANFAPVMDSAPAHPLPAAPAPAVSFVKGSRDWEIKEIQQRLQKAQMLFLSGDAGIGKTQLALQYAAEHAPQKGAYFLQYQPSPDPEADPIRQILLQADFRGYTFTGRDNDHHDKDYAQRLSILREEYPGALLIIDGLDLPGDVALDSDDSLYDLLHTGVKLLFTSRRDYGRAALAVGPLNEEDSLTLMKYHGADKAYPPEALSVAAAAMGHRPLYVDQIARLMGQSPGRITQKQLRLLNNAASPAAAVQWIQTMLRVPIQELSADCGSVLFLASLMPESGLPENLFRYALNNAQKRALTSLLQDNWLLKSNKYLSVHPYIRQACPDTVTPPAAENCRVFLDRLWYYEQSFRWDRHSIQERKHSEQALAQTFAAAAERFPALAPVCSHRIARLLKKTNQLRAALQWELKTLPFLEQTDPWALARACHFVGTCYSLLYEHSQALAYWEKTLHLCEETLSVSSPDLAAAHYHAGCAHLELERYQEASKQLELARILHNETLSETHPFREAVLQKMDIAYAALGQHKIALDYLYSNLTRDPTARYLWLPLPSGVGLPSFFGRETELGQILSMLQRNEKPIIITGLQGSGKTELVLQFARNYQRGQLYFTRFDTTFTRTVASMAHSIRPALSQAELNQSDAILCRMVMDILRNCSAYDILIIDDVESDAISQKEPIYRELLELDCRLILTTVSAPVESIRVQPLPYEALVNIFRKHGAWLEESEMHALIDAVNGHTLTIDLIARMLGGSGDKSVTAAQLLEAFSHDLPAGAGMQQSPAGDDAAGQPLYEHLRTIFRLAQLSPSAREILRYAVLIPDQGIDVELFSAAIPKAHRDGLNSLASLTWINAKDGIMTVQPVVRLACHKELNPTDESCGAFLDALWAQYSPSHYNAVRYRQMAEVFSRASQILEDRQADYILRAGTLWHAIGEYQRSREILDDSLPRYEHILPPDSPKLARLYNNAGRTYSELGMLANALEYTMRALAICEKIYAPHHAELAASYRNVGSTYSALGNYDIALEYLQKALSILEIDYPNDPDLAATNIGIGNVYSALGNQENALEYQLKALKLLEKVLPPVHPDLASSYHNVGTAYGALGNHRKALDYQLKALDICIKVLPPKHLALADAYQGVGNCYIPLGNYERAKEYLLKSLEIYEKSLPSGHPKLVAIRDSIVSLEMQTETEFTIPIHI